MQTKSASDLKMFSLGLKDISLRFFLNMRNEESQENLVRETFVLTGVERVCLFLNISTVRKLEKKSLKTPGGKSAGCVYGRREEFDIMKISKYKIGDPSGM